jgi:hypothetical protein
MKEFARVNIDAVSKHNNDFFRNVVASEDNKSFLVSTDSNKLCFFESVSQIGFQKNCNGVIYDFAFIRQGEDKGPFFIASMKNEPVKFFEGSSLFHLESIKKPNSEDFRAPLKISNFEKGFLFTGKSLLKIFDLGKMKFSHSLEKVENKKNQDFSDCHYVNENFIVAGLFSGEIVGIDLRQPITKIFSNKTHFDAITCIAEGPEHQFLTGARKDDNVYLWVR